MSDFDVAVVGGGPAGSTAAYRLAQTGARVLLLDRAVFPRDKPCGGGVTERAARLLPFSIDPVVEDVVDRIECGLDRHSFKRRARGPLVYMTRRRRLDHFLLRQAAAAGADVRDGVRVSDVREGGLSVDGRDIRARIVIGADGCNGTTARDLDLAREIVHDVALEANYPYEARFAHVAVVQIRMVRGGYGWIFPKSDHVNVGVGGYASEARELRAALKRMCEAHGIDPRAASAARGYRLPMRLPTASLARGRTAVIGDAAGLVDPFTGDGMYEAFLSAKLVAEAALDVLAGRADTLESYARSVEQWIAPLARAEWSAKDAFDRFPRATFALARLPATFSVVEKLFRGEIDHPAATRSVERIVMRAIGQVAHRASR